MTTHDDWLDQAAKEMVASFSNGAMAGRNLTVVARDVIADILATRPAPGRAEVEREVEAYRDALRLVYTDAPIDECDRQVTAARTRLLALYAEPQGEVYEVEAFHDLRAVFLPGPYEYQPGQRVRVVKVAE